MNKFHVIFMTDKVEEIVITANNWEPSTEGTSVVYFHDSADEMMVHMVRGVVLVRKLPND